MKILKKMYARVFCSGVLLMTNIAFAGDKAAAGKDLFAGIFNDIYTTLKGSFSTAILVFGFISAIVGFACRKGVPAICTFVGLVIFWNLGIAYIGI